MKKSTILKLLALEERWSTCKKYKKAAFVVTHDGCLFQGHNYMQGYEAYIIHREICDNICKNCLAVPNFDDSACPAIHAPIAALIQTQRSIGSDDVMILSYSPCLNCCKAIVESGIGAVIVKEPNLNEPEVSLQKAYKVKTNDELAEKFISESTYYKIKYIKLWEYEDYCEITNFHLERWE